MRRRQAISPEGQLRQSALNFTLRSIYAAGCLTESRRGRYLFPERIQAMDDAPRTYDSDLLRGNTDSLLLFLINERGQTYGYRLIKEIEERSQGYFRFKEGTVYP